jgi:heat shock protein HslJ
MRPLLLAAMLAGATAACDEGLTAPSDVVGQNWRLISIQQGTSPPITVDTSSRYTLRLEDNGRVAVRSDCNSCGGTYTLNGSSLELSGLACTKVACGAESLDPAYVRALEGTKNATLDDDDLIIRGNDVTLVFVPDSQQPVMRRHQEDSLDAIRTSASE